MGKLAKKGCPAAVHALDQLMVLPGNWGRTNNGQDFHVETNVSSILVYHGYETILKFV
jgi:hypothetical protein